MRIISLVHQKGGVGKSTVALNLALAMGKKLDVRILDIDPQGSINNLNPDNVKLLHCSVNEINKIDCDVVIIDTPPYKSNAMYEVLNMSDLIIVPMKAGAFDMLALVDNIGAMNMSQLKKTRILFNMVKHNSSIHSIILSKIRALDAECFKNHLTERVGYIRTILTGGIMASKDKNGAKEFERLCNEIIKLL